MLTANQAPRRRLRGALKETIQTICPLKFKIESTTVPSIQGASARITSTPPTSRFHSRYQMSVTATEPT